MNRRRALTLTLAIGMMLTTAMTAAAPSHAAANNLWLCPSPFDGSWAFACTTIKHAPPSGVQVLDRGRGHIDTLHNGNSVALLFWYKDTGTPRLCGIRGDEYVWSVSWRNGTGYHWGRIGDWYLATGTVPEWNGFRDSRGNLGNDAHYSGTGHGTCDRFPSR